MSKRRNYTPAFKAKVARAAIEGNATVTELAQRYQVHPNLITKWKRTALDSLPDAFANPRSHNQGDEQARIRELHA